MKGPSSSFVHGCGDRTIGTLNFPLLAAVVASLILNFFIYYTIINITND
jgi:hypothetical protein